MPILDSHFSLRLLYAAVFGILLPLLAVACGLSSPDNPAHAQQGKSGESTVTVLIYSGRPNPTFALEASQAEQLNALVKSAPRLPSYEKETVVPSVLGYNGFLVENHSDQGVLPRQLIAYQGMIEVDEGEGRYFSQDHGRTIESFLLDQAISAEVFDARGLALVKKAIGIQDAPDVAADETAPEEE